MIKNKTTSFSVAIALSVVAVLMLSFITASARNSLSEGFESGSKTAYADGSVTLGSGSWYFTDSLIGTSSSDAKVGTKSARIRNVGKVSMSFNVSSAGTVSVKHAKYGTDAAGTWELWQSTNSGSTWVKVGSTVMTSSTTLATASFTVNSSSAVRFEIRKISGGTNRINIDDVTATSYSSGGGSTSVHLMMGNPSGATASTSYPTNYLMVKPQFALSYNNDKSSPNWVSWHLDSTWLGTTPRQDSFRPDTSLPAGWYQVKATDYSGSGYDRGHMCPSGDRTKTVADNDATFLMTNMIPQAPTNNQQTWANQENYLRTLATSGSELYIISGGYGVSGYIAGGNVAVPTYTWKVVMVLSSGTNDVSRVTTSTRLIAIFVPNNNSVVSDWKQYRVSVDYVESLTGYDFFSNVPDSVENTIEAVVDTQ